jgi:hypothetical protein
MKTCQIVNVHTCRINLANSECLVLKPDVFAISIEKFRFSV